LAGVRSEPLLPLVGSASERAEIAPHITHYFISHRKTGGFLRGTGLMAAGWRGFKAAV
jgi:hypothetical protein